MIIHLKNVVPQEVIDTFFYLHRHLDNQYHCRGTTAKAVHDDEVIDRRLINPSPQLGRFLITQVHLDEVDSLIFRTLTHALKQSEPFKSWKWAYRICRILQYGMGDYIDLHKDASGVHETSANIIDMQEANVSCIIPLNSHDNYNGGDFLTEKGMLLLEPGDLLAYTFDEWHGVSRVRKGVRYVVNLRMEVFNLNK